MAERSVSDLLESISLDLGQLARDASWNRMLSLDSASMVQEAISSQNLEMSLVLEELRWEMASELQRQLDDFKASQLPPIAAEVRELTDRARDNEKHQLYNEALEDLLRAEEKQPYDYRLQDWLGSMYLQRFDDAATALSHFDRAVRYAVPRSSRAGAWELLGRSRCKTALGDLQGAYQDTKEALSLDPARPQVLYEHAAHAAAVRKDDEALATLEQAIRYAPVYLLTAAEDERFRVLGKPLSEQLDRMRNRVTQDLESFVAQSRELENAITNWEIAARTFDPDKYDELRLPLSEAGTALLVGSYPAQAKALKSMQQGLPKLVVWIDKELAATISRTESEIVSARSRRSDAAGNARSYIARILASLLGLLGYLAGIVAAILVFRWGIDFVPLEDLGDVFLDIFKLGGIGVGFLILAWVGTNPIKKLKEMRARLSSRSIILGSSRQYADDASAAGRRLRTLQAQRDSFRPYVERLSMPSMSHSG